MDKWVYKVDAAYDDVYPRIASFYSTEDALSFAELKARQNKENVERLGDNKQQFIVVDEDCLWVKGV